ncbi:electron transfer flavoprotein-ubiquinone oxidoreductase, partial [Pseudomonas syringae pv. japonica str. M301072]
GVVRGIVTGDLGVDREGNPKEGLYTPGMELRAKYTLFAEGCRGPDFQGFIVGVSGQGQQTE